MYTWTHKHTHTHVYTHKMGICRIGPKELLFAHIIILEVYRASWKWWGNAEVSSFLIASLKSSYLKSRPYCIWVSIDHWSSLVLKQEFKKVPQRKQDLNIRTIQPRKPRSIVEEEQEAFTVTELQGYAYLSGYCCNRMRKILSGAHTQTQRLKKPYYVKFYQCISFSMIYIYIIYILLRCYVLKRKIKTDSLLSVHSAFTFFREEANHCTLLLFPGREMSGVSC